MIGIMSFVFPMALIAWIALCLLLLVAAIADRRTLAQPEDFLIEAKAPRDPRLSTETRMELRLEVLSPKVFRLSELRILAAPIPFFGFKQNRIAIKPQRNRKQEYFVEFKNVQVRELGYQQLTHWPLAMTSQFGLFVRSCQMPIEPIEFRVSPERRKLEEQAFQELIQTQKVLFQGARQINRSRSAEQFHSIRKYQFPDSLRHIDHKKSARYQQPMTRIYEAQHSHHLVLALDTGRSMLGDVRGSRKSDYYLSAALALAENALRSRDRVSLFSFADKRRSEIRSARNFASFLPLFRATPEFSPIEVQSDYGLIPKTVSQIAGSRAIVVVLTDISKSSVQDSLIEVLGQTCRKHLTVVISLSDRDNDIDAKILAFDPQSSETREIEGFKTLYSDLLYSYWAREKEILFRDRFARMGGGSLNVNDADWIASIEKLYSLLRTSQLA